MTKPTVDKRFIVNLKGKEFVTYEGLLDTAHQIGIKSIETKLIQLPSEENNHIAVAMARVTTEDDRVFEEIGDAGPQSVNRMIQPHIIRMAFTRAKARALRDLTNIGMTALEELGGDEEPMPKQQVRQTQKRPVQADKGQQASNTVVDKCSSCGTGITAKVKQYSINKYKKALCFNCQQKEK